MADDVPELVSELTKRSVRIAQLESKILAAKLTPDDLVLMIEKIEASARAKLHDLRAALADQRDLREVFLTLFPDGLTFTPARAPNSERHIWRITGSASFGSLVDQSGPD